MAIRPVTHTALVDVKRASIKLTFASDLTETGSSSNNVPNRIAAANPSVISRPAGCLFKKIMKRFMIFLPFVAANNSSFLRLQFIKMKV